MVLKLQFGNLAFTTYGNKGNPAVTFIHGFPFSREMWSEQCEVLSKDHYVVAYDIRGHGESSVGSGQYLIEMFVDDLISLLDFLDLKSTTLCGLSMGGYIAQRAVDRAADRFSGLILCDTKSTADTNTAKLNRANQIKTIVDGKKEKFVEDMLHSLFAPASFEKNGDGVEKIKKIMNSTDDHALIGTLIALSARMDMTDSLSNIKIPTLILVGDQDKLTTVADADLMHTKIRGSEVVIVKESGHVSNIENAAEFNNAVITFLEKNRL
ncbi:MAG: alpha/beta fold hydrolase [Candidatus Kryptoniota bacterium]